MLQCWGGGGIESEEVCFTPISSMSQVAQSALFALVRGERSTLQAGGLTVVVTLTWMARLRAERKTSVVFCYGAQQEKVSSGALAQG